MFKGIGIGMSIGVGITIGIGMCIGIDWKIEVKREVTGNANAPVE